jgi:hypothetical protein
MDGAWLMMESCPRLCALGFECGFHEAFVCHRKVEKKNPSEMGYLKELYYSGQIWDDEFNHEDRRILRDLERRGLVRVSLTRFKGFRRAFWTITEQGIQLLEGGGG